MAPRRAGVRLGAYMHGSGGAPSALASFLLLMFSAAVAVAQPAAPVPPAPPADLAPPQIVTVKGRVVDSLDHPVRGAQVTTDTSAEPATTDRDGRFTIDAAVGA